MAKKTNADLELEGVNALLDKLGAPRTEQHGDDTITLSAEDRLAFLTGHAGTDDDKEAAKALTTYGRLRGPLFDAIMDRVIDLAIPFRKLNEQQQSDFMRGIRSRIDSHLDRAVRAIIAADLPTITAQLGDFTTKSDKITGKFETSRTMAALEKLGAHGLRPIHIVFGDPKMIDDQSYNEKTRALPDQPEFDDLLSQGNDEDLANAGDDDEGEAKEAEAETEEEGTD